MSLNKKLLAGTIAGLLISTTAGAVNLNTGPARNYAQEMTKPVAITDAADTIEVAVGYNFSPSEVRYARLECSNNLTIANPAVASSDAANLAVGAVNGAGTPALFFSLTADAALAIPTAPIVVSLASDNTLTSNANVDCSFSLYDQPSQAQAGGATGRIYTTGPKAFIRSIPSFEFLTTPGQAIADVEAIDGAYTDFLSGGVFGEIYFDLVANEPFKADGTLITMADLFAAGTNVTIAGDFSAAADVEFSNWGPADTVTDDDANFIIGSSWLWDDIEYIPNFADQILESTYTATLDAVANAGYTIADVGPLDAGEIVRNGTQLQAPLAQLPANWLSRVVITNTGALDRPYEISVFGETGNTISTNAVNMTGSVPAGGTKVVDLETVLTGFTGAPRATINLTVAGPNNQIQGLYQIVNPASGSISNHVMVRPGTN
ncbi:hypothetical protein N790_05270 [Arenimonas malthae CC-JY-1]|uniref:Uncharacterized protein n=1 Tax=Arenimonas malthae CC-JY-1 TaxID=1384054 RepID=A0A091BDT5_9GAMM|nr:hypothetical protein [Arenimonas malthae]KFN49702.1 hypothetical protein N790_05270 [Arenimonas malthae CC-JY-1]